MEKWKFFSQRLEHRNAAPYSLSFFFFGCFNLIMCFGLEFSTLCPFDNFLLQFLECNLISQDDTNINEIMQIEIIYNYGREDH